MNTPRWDETWHRLRKWTNDSGQAERLAAQILQDQGYNDLDPSHPLGGPDGGKDAICMKAEEKWIMAVYFPRGQKTFAKIMEKYEGDLRGVDPNSARGIAFVTNQEITLSERKALKDAANAIGHDADVFHLERITNVLDAPKMAIVRKQFLGIGFEETPIIALGGQGGMAPGAGGGGGGVIGQGARGGDGGPGGKIVLADGISDADAGRTLQEMLAFAADESPHVGAGGGGPGIIGDGSIGGQGGGGGDLLYDEISIEAGQRLEIRVGRGGENGGTGEDSIVNLVSQDGSVLNSLLAVGGQPGEAAKPARIGRSVRPDDVQNGFGISSIMLAECAQIRHGLLYLLGGGWEYFEFQTCPFTADWPLVLVVSMGQVGLGDPIELFAVVDDPKGFQTQKVPFVVNVSASTSQVFRLIFVIPLHYTGSVSGIWSISIVSGESTLAVLPIEVRCPAQTCG